MRHEALETRLGLLLGLILLCVNVGTVVTLLPLLNDSVPSTQARPYTPLTLMGREIYLREGCHGCHSQLVRPFRHETVRYGHISVAAESRYDHPFQWGSKRTGPDLARVGGKYSDQWHAQHLTDPRSLVPDSLMPGHPWLARTRLRFADVAARMRVLRRLGVPYSATAQEHRANVTTYGAIDADRFDILQAEESLIVEAEARDGDGDPSSITELDALIAYLQGLGTQVDFKHIDPGWMQRLR